MRVSFLFLVLATLLGSMPVDRAYAAGESKNPGEPASESDDSARVLPGGTEGAELRSLTVTGENRIRIEFDRPVLRFELDPRSAPGLEWGNPLGVLLGDHVDLETPLLAETARADLQYLADPWARAFRSGVVARFQPELEGVSEWRLVIANSLSDTVAVFSGNGDPPDEIEWDGRSRAGRVVSPGLVYSYSLEAADRAGNRRTFVGPGFRLPAYRTRKSDAHVLLFTGDHLPVDWQRRAPDEAPALLLEAVSLANRRVPADVPIEVRVAAPTFEFAQALAQSVADCLIPRLLGDPVRVRTVARAESGAPESGDLVIVLPER